MRKVDLSMYSDEELESIGRTVNMWEWDDRIGKKPWMFDQMERYKKFDNIAYRKKMLRKRSDLLKNKRIRTPAMNI